MENRSDAEGKRAIPTDTEPLPESEREQALACIRIKFEAAQRIAGLASRHRCHTFANFDAERQPVAYQKARAFVDGDRRSLVFYGDLGLGKTHLAAAIVNEILRQSPYVTGVWGPEDMDGVAYFIALDDALRQLRDTYQEGYSGMGERWLLERWRKVPVLVLDEVGQRGTEAVQRGKKAVASDHARRIGYDIVDGRYRETGKPLIITTNRDPAELCDWITPAAVDRLFEMGDFIEFTGRSHRLGGATERAVTENPMEAGGGS